MGIFDFFLKKLVKQPTLVKPPIQTEQETVSVKIDYGKSTKPTVKVQTQFLLFSLLFPILLFAYTTQEANLGKLILPAHQSLQRYKVG